jgi:hypothetical protein
MSIEIGENGSKGRFILGQNTFTTTPFTVLYDNIIKEVTQGTGEGTGGPSSSSSGPKGDASSGPEGGPSSGPEGGPSSDTAAIVATAVAAVANGASSSNIDEAIPVAVAVAALSDSLNTDTIAAAVAAAAVSDSNSMENEIDDDLAKIVATAVYAASEKPDKDLAEPKSPSTDIQEPSTIQTSNIQSTNIKGPNVPSSDSTQTQLPIDTNQPDNSLNSNNESSNSLNLPTNKLPTPTSNEKVLPPIRNTSTETGNVIPTNTITPEYNPDIALGNPSDNESKLQKEKINQSENIVPNSNDENISTEGESNGQNTNANIESNNQAPAIESSISNKQPPPIDVKEIPKIDDSEIPKIDDSEIPKEDFLPENISDVPVSLQNNNLDSLNEKNTSLPVLPTQIKAPSDDTPAGVFPPPPPTSQEELAAIQINEDKPITPTPIVEPELPKRKSKEILFDILKNYLQKESPVSPGQ